MSEPLAPVVAESVATSVSGTKSLSQSIETAMADAVYAASKETEEIWANAKISAEEKQKQISAIMDPVELKRRMMAARDVARGAVPVASLPDPAKK